MSNISETSFAQNIDSKHIHANEFKNFNTITHTELLLMSQDVIQRTRRSIQPQKNHIGKTIFYKDILLK